MKFRDLSFCPQEGSHGCVQDTNRQQGSRCGFKRSSSHMMSGNFFLGGGGEGSPIIICVLVIMD